jgi:hypothetical protein
MSISATAAWAQVNISNSSYGSWFPRLAVDGAGDVHAVWAEIYGSGNGDLFYSRRDKATGAWSGPVDLSESGRVWSDTLMLCGCDLDGSGNLYVVWTAQNAVMLRVGSGGGWSDVSQIGSGSGLDGARIAATAGGDLFCTWWSSDGTILTRARINGGWEGVQQVSEGGRRSKFPDIGVGSGQAMSCWVEKSGDIYQAAYAVRGAGYGAGWSSGTRLAPSSISQQHPVVEYADGSTPHIVFTPVPDPDRIVQHCAWTGSGFSAPRSISDQTMLHYPSLAEQSGKLCAVWQVGAYGNGMAVYQNVYQNGSWSGQSAVSGSAGATFCDAAIDGSGIIHVAWDAGGEIYYSTSGSGGGTSSNRAPVADFAFSPSTGIAPLTVSFDGSASYDPDGSIASYSWIFGDGATGSGRTVNHTYQKRGNFGVKLTVVDNLGKPGSAIKTVQVQGLFAPLSVAWSTHTDRSLFQVRTVNQVTWAYNPANDDVAAVVRYRVYRKRADEDESYTAISDVEGTIFFYNDAGLAKGVTYLYAVTSLDAEGHESPLSSEEDYSAEETDGRSRIFIGLQIPKR